MKYITSLVVFLFITEILCGQVSAVNYDLKYDPVAKLHDVYLIVSQGSASKRNQLIQFNSQISFFAPKGSIFEIERSYLPLYSDGMPMNWEISNIVDDIKSMTNEMLISVKPSLSKTSFYTPLSENDTVKLFSIKNISKSQKQNTLRLYKNLSGLPSTENHGSDFNNGFTIGSVKQVYKEDHKVDQIITKISEQDDINIYPVPATDLITISIICNEGAKIFGDLIDPIGRVVHSRIINENRSNAINLYTISLSCSTGIYTLRLNVDGRSYDYTIPIVNP
jgi:hypothetical protein